MFSSLVALVLALLRAFPALVPLIHEIAQREREATALRRKQEKDAAVDRAIDGGKLP